MRQAQREFVIDTHGQGLYEFTREVERWLREERLEQGLLSLFCRHSSASLLIQENADPDVVHDLRAFFARLAPEGASLYRHSSEGPDDMPAHIRAALTPTSLTIPIRETSSVGLMEIFLPPTRASFFMESLPEMRGNW